MPIQLKTEKDLLAQKDSIRKSIEKDQTLLLTFLADPMHALQKLGYVLEGTVKETCLKKWATRKDPDHQSTLEAILSGKKVAWVDSVSFRPAGGRK